MANEHNLIPFNQRTEKEQREFARMGGIASGKARKKKKTMKDTLNLILSTDVKDEELKQSMTAAGFKEEDQDYQMVLMMSVFKRAVKGDQDALNYITNILGETPKEESSGESTGGTIVVDDLEYEDDEDIEENSEEIEEL